jgi:hypothetical protein
MNHSPLSPTPATSVAAWKERYEAVRQLAVAGNQILGAEPLGLLLLLRQGVAHWMGSWPRPAERPSQAPALPTPSPVLPLAQWQQQLTTVLAQMSLAHLSNPRL